MGKQKTAPHEEDAEVTPNVSWGDLYELSNKIRGIGYLIEHQKPDQAPPFDLPQISEGIGLIVQELGERVYEYTSNLEDRHLPGNDGGADE